MGNQLQELRKNIPQNVLHSDSNPINKEQKGSNKQIKQEITSLLDDILHSKPEQSVINEPKIKNDMDTTQKFIKAEDFENMMQTTNSGTAEKYHVEDEEEKAKIENGEDKTMTHLRFTNLRLENCKLREEMRKLKSQSKYSSVFDDYDLEIKKLNKLLESMGKDNKMISIKNMQLKHDLNNCRLSGNENKSAELKTVRSLQRSLRETTKKLKEREVELTKLTSNIRHSEIRIRVLQTSKNDTYDMAQTLSETKEELAKSYLAHAEVQAVLDKLRLQKTELEHENNTLQTQTKSLENEVMTLRRVCKKYNDDIKQNNQLHRVSKKWASGR